MGATHGSAQKSCMMGQLYVFEDLKILATCMKSTLIYEIYLAPISSSKESGFRDRPWKAEQPISQPVLPHPNNCLRIKE